MPQLRDGDGLLLEALAEARLFGEERGEHFDGHVARERWLVGLVDGGHAPAADLLDDAVRPDVRAGDQGHAVPSCSSHQRAFALVANSRTR